MRDFLIRRALLAVVTLWGVTMLVFILSRLGPDPLLVFIRAESYGLNEETVQKLKVKWGLDRPLIVQYGIWVGRIVRGDLGRSIGADRPVTRIIGEKMPATLQLGVVAWFVSTVVGIPLGVLSAVRRGSVWDYFGRFIALIGQATPRVLARHRDDIDLRGMAGLVARCIEGRRVAVEPGQVLRAPGGSPGF